MQSRTRREDIVFRRPFTLKGWTEPRPAGAYAVDTEEELVEGLSFPAYRGVSTTITRRGTPAGALVEAIPVDPRDLAKAHAADSAAGGSAGESASRGPELPPARQDPGSAATHAEKAMAQPAPARTRPPNGLADYVSGHRFGLLMLGCALALALMLAAVYATAGFAPVWARFDAPAA